jgi:hypothetical protein
MRRRDFLKTLAGIAAAPLVVEQVFAKPPDPAPVVVKPPPDVLPPTRIGLENMRCEILVEGKWWNAGVMTGIEGPRAAWYEEDEPIPLASFASSMDVKIFLDNATLAPMIHESFASGEDVTMRIIEGRVGTSTATEWKFDGYITELEAALEGDGPLTVEITVRVTGVPRFTMYEVEETFGGGIPI